MRACFMSLAVTVLDFVFSLSFVIKWITSTATRSVFSKVLYSAISMRLSRLVHFCVLA